MPDWKAALAAARVAAQQASPEIRSSSCSAVLGVEKSSIPKGLEDASLGTAPQITPVPAVPRGRADSCGTAGTAWNQACGSTGAGPKVAEIRHFQEGGTGGTAGTAQNNDALLARADSTSDSPITLPPACPATSDGGPTGEDTPDPWLALSRIVSKPGQPDGDGPAAWQDWMRTGAKRRHLVDGWPMDEAVRLAWGDAINAWHERHGARPDPRRCAGCDARLEAADGTETMIDGAVVHQGGRFELNCQ